jgi:hypothetical protein
MGMAPIDRCETVVGRWNGFDMLIRCPDCNGVGRYIAQGFACGAKSQAGAIEVKCSQCCGSGVVDPTWRALGLVLKAKRIAADVSLREDAQARGVRAVDLSDAEHGRIDPTPYLNHQPKRRDI